MSLPSYALIFDSQGNKKDEQFVNSGWFCTYDSIASTICRDMDFSRISPDDVIHIYGMKFNAETLFGCNSQEEVALMVKIWNDIKKKTGEDHVL